ncbi:hypothetical protein PENSTE_c026G04460 [Penicillium steckii]|uniref:DUF7730 domain-containing protein n=1 Tax=Penicillium steckii TaxID=303698 RepID=A0A1V6SQM5_9EURO|nr:hypothetical protein PENSTE_c026G04460 [Penicillium steckii]
MRHFEAWLVRDPYSIWHYYTTGNRWQDTVRDLIHDRSICSAPDYTATNTTTPSNPLCTTTPASPQTTPLLTLLPPEIRSMIWSYVFGSDTLHLVQIKNKVKHVRCSSSSITPGGDSDNDNDNDNDNGNDNVNDNDTSLTHHRHCCPLTPARWRIYDGRIPGHSDRLLYPHTHTDLPSTLSKSPISLLTSCKTIYTETLPYLYKNNTFDIDDLYTFISFTSTISPTALSNIKSLILQWTPIWTPLTGQEHKGSIYAHTHSDFLWIKFWKIVASLPHLHSLKMSIDLGKFMGTMVGGGPVVVGGTSGRILSLNICEEWVRPLLDVSGLKEFDLAVTARCDVTSRGVIEGDLVRDAAVFREDLRNVLMRRKVFVPGCCEDGGENGRKKEKKRVLAITAG